MAKLRTQLIHICLITLVVASARATESEPFSIRIKANVLAEFRQLIPEARQDLIKSLEPVEYSHSHAAREMAETQIVLRALAIGNYSRSLELLPMVSDYQSQLDHLLSGKVAMVIDSVWRKDAEALSDRIFMTEPVFLPGQYHAGFYTHPETLALLPESGLDFSKLSAISNHSWSADWQLLTQLKLARLEHVETWPVTFKAVYYRKVDFMLAPFSYNPGLELNWHNMVLVPIEGYKASFSDSRHFLIGKSRPGSKTFSEALNKGLRVMRNSGEIERIFTESGIFNSQVKTWQALPR